MKYLTMLIFIGYYVIMKSNKQLIPSIIGITLFIIGTIALIITTKKWQWKGDKL